MAVLIRRVVVDPVTPGSVPDVIGGEIVDVRTVGDRIDEIGPHIAPRPGDETVDGRGGPILPGLHDHHVHLWAWAAAAESVDVAPPAVDSADSLARCLRAAPGAPGTWIRAIGYHESAAGLLDRETLDRLLPDRPARIQHRSGALWVLNSLALERLGLDPPPADASTPLELDTTGRPTGRVWRGDTWLRERLATFGCSQTPDLAAISRRAASLGVTGLTDATPDQDHASLAALIDARTSGLILQRLHLMVGRDALGPDGSGPSTSASAAPGWPATITPGPVKVMLDDERLPTFDELVTLIGRAHSSGRPVAVHCVTRTQGALAVAAFSEAGAVPGDRIEHGSLIGLDLVPTLRRLGLIVVTQPGFLHQRGDRYLADVAAEDGRDLWRLGSLLDAGIPIALSTDAPFGPDDPWSVIQSAASRRTAAGRLIGPGERIAARRAVALFCGEGERPRRRRVVTRGGPADLVVLTDPLDDSLASGSPTVLATVAAGTIVHRAEAG